MSLVDQQKNKCICSRSGPHGCLASLVPEGQSPTFLMTSLKMCDDLWLGQSHCSSLRVSDLEGVREQRDMFPGRFLPLPLTPLILFVHPVLWSNQMSSCSSARAPLFTPLSLCSCLLHLSKITFLTFSSVLLQTSVERLADRE